MYHVSVFVHIVAAMVWIGGMLFLALAIVPVTRHLPAVQRSALLGAIGRRFRTIGWISLALLIVTGIVSTSFRGVAWESVLSGAILGSWFGQVLAIKLVLVAATLAMSAAHDFVVGPASVRVSARQDEAAHREAASLRRLASWMGRLNALIALLIVALAVILVRGLP
ncbi:MAG TPA: CopD family protein [Chloroflexota bacterium]|nr:CopD family protein [Chloroflexota bacterium]